MIFKWRTAKVNCRNYTCIQWKVTQNASIPDNRRKRKKLASDIIH